MAYYSGQASSYQELLNILTNACVDNDWVWADEILSKNGVFIKLQVLSTGTTTGIKATGGTGKAGSTLINPSPTSPRMGNMHPTMNLPNFPVLYHLFIFNNEVYLIFKFNLNSFYYLAFGRSYLNPDVNNFWISATSCGAGAYNNSGGSVTIFETNGGAGGGGNPTPVAPFWNMNSYTDDWTNSVLMHGLDGGIWSTANKNASVVAALVPLIYRQPSGWNSEAIFTPINVLIARPQNKYSIACIFENSRFLRVDNYDPEQIINMGSEKWMILPFYKKNISERNGGGFIDHTGTFGWAIRYDGS